MALQERRGGPPCFPASGWTTVIKARKTPVQITVFNQSAWEMICTSFSVLDSTASRALPVSTLPKTWWEIWRAIGHLPFEREGVSFHFSHWVLPATVTMGTPSWPPSIQALTPFNVHFHKTTILFTERSSLTRSFSVNGYADNFSVRGHSKNWAFRGTKWKYGK